MKRPIKKLPKSVQTLICASNQINSYNKAVQELVFNSLDANATSIAVRMHITEGSIQVVDNGCGIPQEDFKLIGQNYMTSKLIDVSTLKSAPNKYGFQGQSLASLCQISKSLKVTSRIQNSETTCMKTFENGKAKSTTKCITRPSKGTSIEIKGFFYNLNIQKKLVNLIYELQDIKTFLEHISLVHPKISISLRDDANNEIVYKIHKNRDMYQTLSNLYDIDKTNVQEMQVEKNQYRVKAYVGKNDVESSKHFIFLNGKLVSDSSTLQKRLNDNFKKHLKAGRRKIQKNFNHDDENHIFDNKIPFYFLFITCPYIDYELSDTVLEFKDWGQMKALLEKLVKFYIGDAYLTKLTSPKKQITLRNKQETEGTTNQIENIMRKILGNHCKNPEISQMQNGVKGKIHKFKLGKNDKHASTILNFITGKLIKRKPKSKTISKIVVPKQIEHEILINTNDDLNRSHEQRAIVRKIKTAKQRKCLSTCFSPKLDIAAQHTKPKDNSKSKKDKSKKMKKQKQSIQDKNFIKNKRDKFSTKKILLNDKFALETESVKRKCEILAQKNREHLKGKHKIPEVFINKNVLYTQSNFTENNKNIVINKRVKETIIREYIPLPSKGNINSYKVIKKYKKPILSNYDLLKTVINSQVSENDLQTHQVYNMDLKHEKLKRKNKDILLLNQTKLPNINNQREDKVNLYSIKTPEQNFRPFIKETEIDETIDEDVGRLSPFYEMTSVNRLDETGNRLQFVDKSYNTNIMSLANKSIGISPLQTENLDCYNIPCDFSFQEVTFHSHNYNDHYVQSESNKKNRNFITTQSKDNFMTRSHVQKKLFRAKDKFKINKNNLNKLYQMFNSVKSTRDSYTIEYTESNGNKSMNYNKTMSDINHSPNNISCGTLEVITPSSGNFFNNACFDNTSLNKPNNSMPVNCYIMDDDLNYEPINKNTYTPSNSYTNSNIRVNISSNQDNFDIHGTYIIEKSFPNTTSQRDETSSRNTEISVHYSKDFIFVPKSQKNNENELFNYPIDVCETVLRDQVSFDELNNTHSSLNRGQKNIINNDGEGEINDCRIILNSTQNTNFLNHVYEKSKETAIKYPETQIDEEVSHHFTLPDSVVSEFQHSLILNVNENDDKTTSINDQINDSKIVKKIVERTEGETFKLKNRLLFVPKGMSPIFEERQCKQYCQYDAREEYYEDELYNDFMETVHNKVEVFKPRIGETKHLATKDISKVNKKLHKDNASLKFDGNSIKNANVLGQVDCKFIATIIKSKSYQSEEEFLVLFDQHAVHERIRLENNLTDYLTENQWKSVTIDEVTLKMSRENILQLHNYRDKFTQFGLEWRILNYNEISVKAIPEGILGKNPRQVDKIIKAVKNLIVEEIAIIQMQHGCVSLYPKSIMDLVFSEACRYAIKFGDPLSKNQCAEMLKALSNCKTPFQCAHGRPVMAVIMNIEKSNVDYEISLAKLIQFKRCKNKLE